MRGADTRLCRSCSTLADYAVLIIIISSIVDVVSSVRGELWQWNSQLWMELWNGGTLPSRRCFYSTPLIQSVHEQHHVPVLVSQLISLITLSNPCLFSRDSPLDASVTETDRPILQADGDP